eukprot:scaffold19665_cov14-Tisochrysis_lutea.AAC.2
MLLICTTCNTHRFSICAARQCSKDVAGVVAEGHDIHAEELMRGLLAFEANAHGFRGGQAVFKFGSKLAHTCNQPNTNLSKHAQLTCALRYKSSDDGYGCHIAVRDIKNGDLLTTSYIDEEHLLCSTSARCDKIGTCSLEATKWDMRALQKWLIFINIHADGCICFARSCKLLQDFIRDKFMFTCCCGSCASADFFRCVAEALAKQLNWTDALIHGADVQEVGSPMKSICVHPMRLRGLPCPLCLPSGGRDAKAMSRLATDFALGQRPLPGTLFFDPSKVGQNRCLRKGPAQLVLKGKNSPRAVGKKAPDAMSQSINQVPLKQK